MSKLVTIFGGSGFVGRYIARRMAKQGWRVRVAVRRPNEAIFVKPYGVVGQVVPVLANIRDDASVLAALEGADAVVCINTIHIVGGGTQNRELCQMTADATGRRVVAGPVEATAIGNLMMQAVAAGEVAGIAEAREVIKQSFNVEEYSPQRTHAWDEAYQRFQRLLS